MYAYHSRQIQSLKSPFSPFKSISVCNAINNFEGNATGNTNSNWNAVNNFKVISRKHAKN